MLLEEHLQSAQVGASFKRLVADLSAEDRESVESFAEKLEASSNTFRELLQLSVEIARRDSIELRDVLCQPVILEALAVGGGRKNRQKCVREALERLRFPKLAEVREELEACVQEILSDTGVRVQLPTDLEGDKLSICVSAKSGQEFSSFATKVDKMSKHPKLERIYAILSGEL